jgi:MFS family permease
MTPSEAALEAERPFAPVIAPWPSSWRAWSAVVLLMVAYCMSYIDRSILALLVQPIKQSLGLSDTRVGLLQAAFGIFFTVAIFPAGWLADRANRMRLVAGALTCWSVMTMLCGATASFTQLFLARMGVAVGEAALQPTAPSIIADNFPPERRTLPLSLYGMAGATGVGISLVAGGFVSSLVKGADHVVIPGLGSFAPWQLTFFIVGLPGLLVALMFLIAREPKRRDQNEPQSSFRELWEVIRSRRAIIVPHFAGVTIYFIYAFAYNSWVPAFFMRVHHWSTSDVGLKYGAMHLVCGLVGGWLGGAMAGALWRRGRRNANLITAAVMFAIAAVPSIFATLAPSGALTLVLLAITMPAQVATAGPNVAAIQEIIPNRLRGRVTAIYHAISALVGVTIGPILIGLMNDYGFVDPQSIGKSLSLTAAFTLPLAALLVYVAARRRAQLDWVE